MTREVLDSVEHGRTGRYDPERLGDRRRELHRQRRLQDHDRSGERDLPGDLHGIQNSNAGRVVVFGGGLPIFLDGRIAGGIGVSGGTVEQDVQIVTQALSTLQEEKQP